ncbi:hypothetical protein BH24ACT5_BH24ACT5_10830 [soil metagenome]
MFGGRCCSHQGVKSGATMLRNVSRGVLTGTLCAASIAMVGGSIAVATTPPQDSSTGTTESSAPPSSGLAVAETTGDTANDVGGVEILAPDEVWGGATRGEWDARWWQWAVSMPEEINPNFDTTVGERCGYGQSGPVFFLPGSFTLEPNEPGFTCVIAEGTAIYVSSIGAECSTVEAPPFFGRTEDELRACATAFVDEVVVEVSATVNGQDVGDLGAYRTSSPLFTLTLADDNIFGVEPGVAQAVSNSYSFIIAPPPPGEYEITGSFRLAGEPEPFVSTITVIVEAPQVIEPPPSTEPLATEPGGTPSPGPESTEPGPTPSPPPGGETTEPGAETTAPASASTSPG